MLVTPWAPKVKADATRMANMIATAVDIPRMTSTRIPSTRRRVTARWLAGSSFVSSTSSDACQNIKYGEMVVPKIATRPPR